MTTAASVTAAETVEADQPWSCWSAAMYTAIP
jgi:hypothetical protein